MNSSLFSFCLLLALTYLVFAADPTGSVSFKANYILTDNSLYPNGQIPGTVYYRFDTSKPQESRVRFEHELYVGSTKETIVELEDFSKKLSFKICGQTCEGYPMSRTAQRWWYTQGDAKQEGDKIGDFTHYTRSLSDYGVSDLWLKNEDLPSNTLYLKKIIFNTGRTLTFVDSTYSTVNYGDSKFDPNAGGVTCSTETCRTFMDLIFVLDSSASVGSSNWNTMVKFVQDVVKQTDISAESGAVAVVGFGGTTCNANSNQCKGTWHSNYIDTADGGWQTASNYKELDGAYDVYKNGVLQMRCGFTGYYDWWGNAIADTFYPENKRDFCKKVWNNERGYKQSDGYTYVDVGDDSYALINGQIYGLYNRCEGDFKNCSYSGNPFISKTYVDLTYKKMDDLVKEIGNKVTYNEGDTCQALGLIKVMDVLNKNKRTDPVDGSVPQRIIIAMTDGDDHCAAETKKYADILRKEYNAIVIEVSITLKHNYDKALLKSISSQTGGNPAYFDVSDFDALQEHIHEMVSTVCQVDPSDVGGSCDKKCKGFCGCGSQCFCPTCDSSLNNECHTYTCESDNKVTAGCVDNPTVCNDNRYCSDDECVVGTGCVYRNRTCGENLKKCQVQKCSESLQGQCGDIESFDSLCPPPPPMHGCYEAICDPAHAGSDSEYGCYYKYKCVGELPVVYDSGSKYVSGCYRYTCDNNTDQCATANVCDEMSAADKCVNYVCNHDEGKCVPDESTRVTCPEINGCRTESKCNSATGICDMTYVTPADCKKRFKDEAKNHLDWFSGDANLIEPYYNCGEHKCDANAEGATGDPTMNQNGHCLFVQGDQEKCGVCNGNYTGQPTFDSCEQEAVEKHNDQPDICFSSTCTSTSSVTSTCVFTNVTCEHRPCMDVVCNPTSLQCEYHWTQEYVEAQYQVTACSELICEDDKPKIVDISYKKCVGENNASVPVCQLYDRCDAYAGCIYKEKCVKDEVCTTMRCEETTNECVKEPVKCQESDNVCYIYECSKNTDKCEVVLKTVEEACGETDLCHEYTCNVIENKCILNEIPYPNGTDKCHNYTCHNSTGEWTVVEKCDDGNICTVDTCTPYDGSCTNFQRDCHEINMTGFGSCFGRACSKSRKNGCFRKVYENSYFDECGNCIRSYSAGDSGLTESEASECKKALSFQEEAAVISAGILAAIIAACVIGAIAVSTAGAVATKELIKRARAARDSGAHDNPLFEDDGQEMENPTFVGTD